MRRIALFAAGILVVSVVAGSASGSAGRTARRSASPILHITFRGAGRKFKECDPSSNCNTSSAAVSWIVEANVAFTKVRSEPAYWYEYKGRAQFDLKQGTDCAEDFDQGTRGVPVGADRTATGQLRIQLGVPMGGISGCDQIPVVAIGGEKFPPAKAKLLNIEWDVGRWDDWRNDTNKGASKSEGTYWRQTIAPLSSDATYAWSGTVSVQEFVSSPPEEKPPPPTVPKLPSQPLKKATEIPPPPPRPPPPQPNPFLTAIINTIKKQVEGLAGRPPQVVLAAVPPANGRLTGSVSLIVSGKTSALATVDQPVRKSVPTQVKLRFNPSGLHMLRRLSGSAKARISVSFDPDTGKTASKTAVATVVAKRRSGTMTSITFSGSPASPAVVVKGRSLGTKPKPSPPYHPAGHSGCPSIASDTGYDYGTSLYVENVTRSFAGGRYRPELNELDCVDLIVTKFTSTEVDFHFGPLLTQNAAKFPFNPGDMATVVVNGASRTVRVSYP